MADSQPNGSLRRRRHTDFAFALLGMSAAAWFVAVGTGHTQVSDYVSMFVLAWIGYTIGVLDA